MLQMVLDGPQFIRQQEEGTQKLSKSWLLWQTIPMLQICMDTPQFIWQNGHTEIVKILAPLTDNPNAPNEFGFTTPISLAAGNGHTKIIKILAPYSMKLLAGHCHEI